VSLEVVQQFGVVELQGLPSKPLRQFGVPPGGAFDTESLAIANVLVGNEPGTPAWEMGMAQATLRPTCDCLIGIAGAFARVEEFRGGFEGGGVYSTPAEVEFTVTAPTVGARVYVAFRAIEYGGPMRFALDDLPDSVASRSRLRVVAGPQADLFDPGGLNGPFSVSQTGNRMGIRLEPGIAGHSVELASEPQCVGSIQVSNDGTLIVIGPDGPTIGGYPKIAVVASCDVPRLAQLRPGDPVRFEMISIEQARHLHAESKAKLDRKLRILKLALGNV